MLIARRRGDRMSNRREFITLLGCAAAALPISTRAQQPDVRLEPLQSGAPFLSRLYLAKVAELDRPRR
jgi:hypothetical protein